MALNTTITESLVILFLGAGASVFLGKPVMKDFVAKLAGFGNAESEAKYLPEIDRLLRQHLKK